MCSIYNMYRMWQRYCCQYGLVYSGKNCRPVHELNQFKLEGEREGRNTYHGYGAFNLVYEN